MPSRLPCVQRKTLMDALPVLSAAMAHLERTRERFNASALPAVEALQLHDASAGPAQPVDKPAEQVWWARQAVH